MLAELLARCDHCGQVTWGVRAERGGLLQGAGGTRGQASGRNASLDGSAEISIWFCLVPLGVCSVFWWPVCLFLVSAVSLMVLSPSFGFWATREKLVFSPVDLCFQQCSPCSRAGFKHFLFSEAAVLETLRNPRFGKRKIRTR